MHVQADSGLFTSGIKKKAANATTIVAMPMIKYIADVNGVIETYLIPLIKTDPRSNQSIMAKCM